MTHFKLKLSVETLDIYVKERSITKLEDRRKSKVCMRHDDKIFNATASNDSHGQATTFRTCFQNLDWTSRHGIRKESRICNNYCSQKMEKTNFATKDPKAAVCVHKFLGNY
jgi:hypothetical protein